MAVSLSIAITQNSQSVANNTSSVTVKVNIKWTYGSWNGYNPSGWLKIDGVQYNFNSSFNTGRTQSGSQTLFTKTVNVSHNADGTKNLSCSAWFASDVTPPEVSATASKTLTTIPRATTPSVSGTLSLGSTITISTSSRASTGFTHNLYYSWGSQVTNSLIASGVATSKSWVIPKTLANYIQGGLSGTMFLKCVTYNGSTVIGEKTITLTVSVPNTEEFQPKINSVTGADANTLPVARYVAGKSALKLTVSAVGAQVSGSSDRNSFLVSASAMIEGVNYSVTLGQNASGTFTITSNLLQKYGGATAVVTVTDSRGRKASMSFAYTVYSYSPPQISAFTAKRCLSNGTIDDGGEYVKCSLKTNVSPVNSLNAKTYKIVYESGGTEVTLKSGTLTYYENNELSYNSYSNGVTFSVDSSWKIRAYVYDSFNEGNPSVASVLVPTEKTFMDWRSNGNGFAYGKVSTRDGFQCGWEMFDRFDTYIRNGLVLYTGAGDSAIDPDVTLEHLVLTNKNTPSTSFWYIMTMFYSTKSETANRAQIAFPYDKRGSFYMRYYYSGAWSAWIECPAVIESGTSGIWTYKKYSDGRVEMWGKYAVSSVDCSVALGSMYRTAVIAPSAFPFSVYNARCVSSYESDGYGAFYWATTATTTTKPPSFYLVRPTSATIASGAVVMHVTGTWN